MRTLSNEYLAGLIDGEGSIAIYLTLRRKTPSLVTSVSFCNTYKPLIFYFKEKFGGTTSVSFSSTSTKPCYKWQARQDIIIPLLKRIFPFLVIKKGQAKLVLEAYKHLKSTEYRGGSKQISKKIVAYRRGLVSKCKKLNHRSFN